MYFVSSLIAKNITNIISCSCSSLLYYPQEGIITHIIRKGSGKFANSYLVKWLGYKVDASKKYSYQTEAELKKVVKEMFDDFLQREHPSESEEIESMDGEIDF